MTDSLQNIERRRLLKKESNKRYREKCKEKIKNKQLDYIRSINGLIHKMYNSQMASSIRRNHQMPEYSLDEFKEWVMNQSGFISIYNSWVNSGFKKNLIPSCDRLDDYKHYTIDNIKLVTWEQNKARGHSDRRNGTNNKFSKSIYQLSPDGEIICLYQSSRIASRMTNINQAQISRCCNNKNKTAGGFIWKFA